jgi:hypothetical protein
VNDETIVVHAQEEIERNLDDDEHTEDQGLEAEAFDGFAIVSASGFAIV